MPVPSVSITRARAQARSNPGVDFAMCVIGCASDSPLDAGMLSPAYSSPAAFAADYGIGDGVDAVTQALTKTNDNPSPPAVSFYATPATNDGTYGTPDHSLTIGTAIPTVRASSSPLGTYQIRTRVTDDGNSGAGTTIGTSGIVLESSVDDGRTWLPTSALGTASSYSVYLPASTPIDTGVQIDLEPPTAQVTAYVTYINAIRTAVLAHFPYTTGTVHGAADTTSDDGIGSAATNVATGITLSGQILAALVLHFARGSTVHLTADVGTSLAAATTAQAAAAASGTAHDAIAVAKLLETALETHEASTTYHTIADAVNVVSATQPTYGTLKTDDEWSVHTKCPTWAIADLYTAGPPDTGALAVIADSAQNFGMIVITEPVVAGDIATLKTALSAMTAKNASKRPTLIVRFRDPNSGETDAQYITAFQTFRAAAGDDERIVCVAGTGWLTDLYRGYVYERSGLADLLARIQGMSAIGGALGEKVAQSPGYAQRGPLPNFSVRDSNGDPVGHDEALRSGILGPNGGKGGGLCFYYEAHETVAGTYVAGAPTMYPQGSNVLTLMDNRVSSGIERVLYAVAFTFLQGADIFDADTLTLDDDIRDAMASAAMRVIKADYANEIQNADDPNLVTVSDTVTVDGPNVTISWQVNDRLFGYTNRINITIANTR